MKRNNRNKVTETLKCKQQPAQKETDREPQMKE